jgi:3-methylfumaryl-CoA hydratase
MTTGTTTRTEVLVRGPAEALAVLIDVPEPQGPEGLPLLWHWLYLLDRPAQADLGPDGHPVRGAFPNPPRPGLRRMWAGGRVRSLGPLLLERPATRRSRVLSSEDKIGRTGPMTFVTVRHEVSQDGRLRVEEDQTIVYRPSVESPAEAPVGAEPEVQVQVQGPPSGAWLVDTPATLLFRFSALTYNGHRIHYDRAWAEGVEGYPGLVVHGPLQALLMAELIRREQGAPQAGAELTYRLLAPAFEQDGLAVAVDVRGDGSASAAVWTRSGRRTASGTWTAGVH